ncbi:hypothetical protein NAP1_07200 [Erythrobacter sp. NAP1]|uniref:hypothetical protein n=1 Tax=Erythrobacter sp. NAP1 TaxID=237727 RepID=UPI000068698A|nr:hypothetical protein [Erythrobacter sp. NAP1]EAQ30546.1 hypothetical protein NAP1_07200 [Erythrobacter sp. NAP1]
MSLRFAPANRLAHAPACTPIAKALAVRAQERVANDNNPKSGTKGPVKRANAGDHKPANDQMLRAALRHFAEHGLGAARQARAQAEKAFFEGDRQAYDWWLGITRTLDRRLAAEAANLGPNGALS